MDKKTYWKKNLRYLVILLSIWFVVGILCSIVFVEPLNMIKLGGFPLGFWFAMQGAMIVSFAVIFIVSRFFDDAPQEIQDMVENIRYPK